MDRFGWWAFRSAALSAALAGWPAAAETGTDGTRTIALRLSADEAVPVVGVRAGELTTLSFRDAAGAPRRIVAIDASTDAVEVVRAASHPHVATLRAVGRRRTGGNLVALVDGIAAPVHFSLAPDGPRALRVVVSIDAPEFADGPAATGGVAGIGEIEAVVRDYILAHPEVIREALDPARRIAAKAEELRGEIAAADVPAAGDPAGPVTVVEFFDYGCGYCRRSAPAVREAIARAGVRVQLRDHPVLGPDSERASRLALAAGMQGRYEDAHFALMARAEGFGPGAAADLAAELGLDAARLEADMGSAEVARRIDANRALARRLGVEGTPAFVVLGPEAVRVAPGAVDAARLNELSDAVY